MDRFLTYTIVLNYNNYYDTIECVESLLNLKGQEDNRIIIIDNFSPNDSCVHIENWLKQSNEMYRTLENAETLESLAPDIKIIFIKNYSNNGYGSGNNIGIRLALKVPECKYVWVLNNDTTLDENALTELISCIEQADKAHRKIGMLGSKILYYHTPTILQCVGCRYNAFLGFPKQIGLNLNDNSYKYDGAPFDYVSGASIFSTKDAFSKVGVFNEDFFLYFEEIDLATRLKNAGYEIDVCLKSIVYHKEGASTKDDPKSSLASPFSDYHFTRSKLIFTSKFFPQYLFSNYVSLLLVLANRIRRKQFRNLWPIIKAGVKK